MNSVTSTKYGDDDLDSGSINPHQLFLVFNELAEAEANPRDGFNPSYMIDQSHNVTDPIESLLNSARAIAGAYVKALIVNDAAVGTDIDSAPDVAMARQDGQMHLLRGWPRGQRQ